MKKYLFLTLIFAFVISNFVLYADSLDETLESLSGEAAESYVSPIVSAFGSNLNGGWFHWAPEDKILGLDVEFGLVFMGSVFPDDVKTFDAMGTFQFTEYQAGQILSNTGIGSNDLGYNELVDAIVNQDFELNIHGATIIGEKDDNVMVEFPQQTMTVNVDVGGMTVPYDFDLMAYSLDTDVGGLMEDFSMLPLGAPQLSIGTIYGTKAVFRYVPTYPIPDVGDFDYFGFGIQHNPKAWLKLPLPIDICASYFTQSMNLGDYVTANATAFGFNASKTLGFSFLSITPYAGYMYEMSNMEFKYSYEIGQVNGVDVEPLDIKFDIDGKNSSRITLGATLRLGVFNINADYNIAEYKSLTAGFAVGF